MAKRTYSKVTASTTRVDLTGNTKWVLTLECGHKWETMKRSRGQRSDKPAPTKVVCRECPAAAK